MEIMFKTFFNRKLTIHTIGDSHAKIPWENVSVKNIIIKTNRLGPRLMHTAGENPDLISLKPFNVKKKDIIIFCFGEIDCRCHVWKYRAKGYKKIINSLVEKYMTSIHVSTSEIPEKNVFIHSIVPAIRREQHRHNEVAELPFLGSDQTRASYVLYMNESLKKSCKKNGFNFFDIYYKYVDKEGYLNFDLSDGNVHIGNPKHIEDYLKKNIIPSFKR